MVVAVVVGGGGWVGGCVWGPLHAGTSQTGLSGCPKGQCPSVLGRFV